MFKKIFLATAMIAVVSLAVFAVFSCAQNAYAMGDPGQSTGRAPTGNVEIVRTSNGYVARPETTPVYTNGDMTRDAAVAGLVLGAAVAKQTSSK
jgi:hypothetical protein